MVASANQNASTLAEDNDITNQSTSQLDHNSITNVLSDSTEGAEMKSVYDFLPAHGSPPLQPQLEYLGEGGSDQAYTQLTFKMEEVSVSTSGLQTILSCSVTKRQLGPRSLWRRPQYCHSCSLSKRSWRNIFCGFLLVTNDRQ